MTTKTKLEGVDSIPWRKLKNVLAVRLDNAGDVVMLSPALRAMRQAMPKARITLMASKAGTKVAPMLPWIDGVLTHRALWQDVSGALEFDPSRERRHIEEIAAQGFDAAVVFTSFSQSPHPPAYFCELAGIPHRLGQSKEKGTSLTHCFPAVPDEMHQSERSLRLLECAGLKIARRDLELAVPADAAEAAEQILEDAGIDTASPFILVAPGASCPSRRYRADGFATVIRIVRRRTGLPVVVVGSDAERGGIASMLAAAGEPPHRNIAGCTIAEMTAIIRRADLLIANNSGPMHIADAVRTPMVILFSGTEIPGQWQPRSAPAALLTCPVNCSPCYSFECPYALECLDIPPDQVAAEALRLLDGR